MSGLAYELADWADRFAPTEQDLALADRALRDTLAVTPLAARRHPMATTALGLGEAGRWAAVGHVLDFDDLHLPSTTHVSVVCVPAVLASGGDARSYLAAAGVMTRLGRVLGWAHYAAGWHATCTAGAPAAAVGAAVAMGLDRDGIATALGLAVPGAGGVQRAFGTDAKSLQVGFAVEAGRRAARLAASGATADPAALDEWAQLLAGVDGLVPDGLTLDGPAVVGGLAIKVYPACYALQRPISAVNALAVPPEQVARVLVRTPEATVAPLRHHRPRTGLQAKFSLEYAVATALLGGYQGFAAFTGAAVRRPEAQRLIEVVEVRLDPGGDGLLDGECDVEVHTHEGDVHRGTLRHPPGSPQRPPTDAQLRAKINDCLAAGGLFGADVGTGVGTDPAAWTWPTAPTLLRAALDTDPTAGPTASSRSASAES